MQRRNASKGYGLNKTLYTRSVRWRKKRIFNRIFYDLVEEGGTLDRLITDTTHLKAKRTAAIRSNVFVTYIEEICKKGDNLKQNIGEFYRLFSEYCKEAGVTHKPDMRGIRNRLESMGYDLTSLNGYTVKLTLEMKSPAK